MAACCMNHKVWLLSASFQPQIFYLISLRLPISVKLIWVANPERVNLVVSTSPFLNECHLADPSMNNWLQQQESRSGTC